MKLRSKKIAAICCAAVMVVTCAVPAFAASVSWRANLPRFSQSEDIKEGTHRTTEQHAYVTVTSLAGNYDNAYFFMRAYMNGSWQDVCNSVDAFDNNEGNEMSFNTYVPQNTQMMLVGGNSDWTTVQVEAHGTVDFR